MSKKTYDNILIGGSGFIGSALANALREKGESVLSISRNESAVPPTGIDELVMDIDNPSFPDFPSAQNVFILVGQNSSSFDGERELRNLEKLVDRINRIKPKKIFYLSSVLVYGECQMPAKEDAPLAPIETYSAFKVEAEALLQKRVHPDSRLGILRLSNVYGGPKNRGFIGFVMTSLLDDARENIIVNGNGSQKRDYIFLDDVVSGILAVRDGLQSSDIVNIASGKSTTLLEVIDCLEKVAHTKLSYEIGGTGAKEVQCSRSSNNKLKQKYGFVPYYTLEEGLRKTLERYHTSPEVINTSKKKVLLLGGEGFIGKNILALLSSDFNCFSVADKRSFFPEHSATFLQVNPYYEKVEGKFDVVIHLIDHKVPTEQFLKAEKQLVRNLSLSESVHFILFSSAIVYANPESEYGKRKRALEAFYIDYCQKHHVLLTILRPFNVFGPYQIPDKRGSLVANLLHNSMLGISTEIQDMEAKRDFVYVGDVARCVRQVINGHREGVFDIGSGRLLSVHDLITQLEKVLDQKVLYSDQNRTEFSLNQAVADRSWDSENMVSLDEGLALTAAFYRSNSTLIENNRKRIKKKLWK